MIACDDCKEIEICSCENFCLAPANLTAGESYIVTIVDKFGIEYSQEIVANVYGTLCVDITGFPDGFFNPYIGSLLVTIQLVSAPDDDIQVVYNSINYTCISLKVKDCPNSVANPHTPAPEECLCFTDESQLQSDWNVSNTNSVQYIRNKPTIPTGSCVLIATASSVDFGTAGQTTMTWESGFSLDNTFMVEAIITYVSGTIAGTANVNLLLNAVYAGTFAPDATLAAGFKFYQNIEGGSTGDVTADLILDVTVPYVNPASLVDVKIYGVKYS